MADQKDSYLFKDIAEGKTYDFVNAKLIQLGMNPDIARRYAVFCQAIYNEVQGNHDLTDAFEQIARADKLQPMARQLQLTKSVEALGDVRLSGKAGMVNVFVDYAKSLAVTCGIEVNECALSVAKVALDLASAGAGAVSSVTGVGVVWLVLSVVSTFQDSYDLGKVCFVTP
jgi:hypothetical protein